MTRLNFILFFVLILCALSLVTSQHKARKLYIELQQQQESSRQLDSEWSQLQLEQSTWAMHSRLEQVAGDLLHMHVPDNKHIQIVFPDNPILTKAPQASSRQD
jgi:cell division protein FtsL